MRTAEDIHATIMAATKLPTEYIVLPDPEYSLPDMAYLESLGRRFHALLGNAGFTYVRNRRDCDKFTKLAMAHAVMEHGIFGTQETGFAVGAVYLFTEQGGHAVVGAVLEEDVPRPANLFRRLMSTISGVPAAVTTSRQLVFRLFEPQPQTVDAITKVCLKEIPLSEVEFFLFCWF